MNAVLNESVPDESVDIGKSLSDQFSCSFAILTPIAVIAAAALLVASVVKKLI